MIVVEPLELVLALGRLQPATTRRLPRVTKETSGARISSTSSSQTVARPLLGVVVATECQPVFAAMSHGHRVSHWLHAVNIFEQDRQRASTKSDMRTCVQRSADATADTRRSGANSFTTVYIRMTRLISVRAESWVSSDLLTGQRGATSSVCCWRFLVIDVRLCPVA